MQKIGVNAIGLSGVDGRLIIATRKESIQSIENGKRKIIRDDFSGKIDAVNTTLLKSFLDDGLLPVIAPIALSHEGDALNVDADRAAAFVAGSMNADCLILLTGVPGLLRKFPDEKSLITHLPKNQLPEAIDLAEGRMKKKVLAAEEAFKYGVRNVIISDGRIDSPVQKALDGHGTHIE